MEGEAEPAPQVAVETRRAKSSAAAVRRRSWVLISLQPVWPAASNARNFLAPQAQIDVTRRLSRDKALVRIAHQKLNTVITFRHIQKVQVRVMFAVNLEGDSCFCRSILESSLINSSTVIVGVSCCRLVLVRVFRLKLTDGDTAIEADL